MERRVVLSGSRAVKQMRTVETAIMSAKGIGATATGHRCPAHPKEMVSGYR